MQENERTGAQEQKHPKASTKLTQQHRPQKAPVAPKVRKTQGGHWGYQNLETLGDFHGSRAWHLRRAPLDWHCCLREKGGGDPKVGSGSAVHNGSGNQSHCQTPLFLPSRFPLMFSSGWFHRELADKEKNIVSRDPEWIIEGWIWSWETKA